ncbi:MAG TPA: hypothetical protein PKW08_13520 [Flavobacteriaceae bacterium]|nr:hypothetical protein [Flavobacteriaceae bacterium]HPF12358.1 hypothetical protein [Flavobacteriaceae bacterium]HQU22602.1 hypothetical protein [Flavobacteriaceae bacterium]HQU66266.1 hypothetical protein [Flavobacteriaceae bacterium]HRW45781.1 hypothetical protein [Flavobacteriaceae bacterium]
MHTVLQYLMLLFTGALLHAQNTVEVTNTPYNSPEEAVCSIQLSQKNDAHTAHLELCKEGDVTLCLLPKREAASFNCEPKQQCFLVCCL